MRFDVGASDGDGTAAGAVSDETCLNHKFRGIGVFSR